MIAKRKKFIITGVVILVMIAIICIVIAYRINDETDYVFEGTFVNAEESVEVADATVNYEELQKEDDNNMQENNSMQENNCMQENNSMQDDNNKNDCFKRKSGDCFFV